MKCITCLCIVLAVLFYCVTGDDIQEEIEEYSSGSRIIGGRDAYPGEVPFQVSIQRKYYFGNGSFHWCGGTIIDSEHIITAAHCLSGIPVEELIVFAGVLNKTWQSSESTKVVRNVTQVFLHEDFVYEKYLNDIAIMKVSPAFPEDNSALQPMQLRKEEAPLGLNCTTSGWGLLDSEEYPDILQIVSVPYIPEDECRQIYELNNYTENEIYPGMTCAGYEQGGKDACAGDSGGPLQCGGLLTGIVSWGAGCAEPNYPGVYADVVYYKEWIATQLAKSRIKPLSIPVQHITS
ncbi:trypsin-1-like [Periplaneta americana]|uniref:trypsin-1-like n=1 Tax=Periplaneta americana TaxID=6978 RepID=UPI0037E71383